MYKQMQESELALLMRITLWRKSDPETALFTYSPPSDKIGNNVELSQRPLLKQVSKITTAELLHQVSRLKAWYMLSRSGHHKSQDRQEAATTEGQASQISGVFCKQTCTRTVYFHRMRQIDMADDKIQTCSCSPSSHPSILTAPTHLIQLLR